MNTRLKVAGVVREGAVTSLNTASIEARLYEFLGLNISVETHRTIDSTNSWSMQQVKEKRKLPFVCFAQNQTGGRGRRGKQWLMSAGDNIAMSLSWGFDVSCVSLDLLPLSIAMAIVETLESFGVDQVQVKWPNDVYVKGRKIAGILIETQIQAGAQVRPGALPTIIGVGLNYDMSDIDAELKKRLEVQQGYTDLRRELGDDEVPDFDVLAQALLLRLAATCKEYPSSSARVLQAFRQGYDFCLSKNLVIRRDDGCVLQGVAQGVNEDAELCVLIDGELQYFNSADVSIKADA